MTPRREAVRRSRSDRDHPRFAWGRNGRRLLHSALDEAVRLLDADGGLVYLRTSVPNELRTALSLGFEGYEQRRSFTRLRLKVGIGMFGRAVETRRVVTTGDYLSDATFPHEPAPDRAIATLGVRSMIVAPLFRSTRVIGALGVHTSRPHAFGEEDAVLVRALADHAASAIHNAELIAELRDSRGRLARRIEVERTLRELAAALTALGDPTEVLQRIVESATSLLVADGSRIDLLEEREGRLYWGYDATARRVVTGSRGRRATGCRARARACRASRCACAGRSGRATTSATPASRTPRSSTNGWRSEASAR